MTRICFLDLETTGLDPARHEPWEIGVIVRDDPAEGASGDVEYLWRVEPDLTAADPNGLRVGRYYKRTAGMAGPKTPGASAAVNLAADGAEARWSSKAAVAADLAVLLDGAHIVGAVPSFDAAFLSRWLPRYGQAFTAHYHLIDVEALAVGYLHGTPDERPPFPHERLPWDSSALSRAVGVDPDQFDRHTALGDARWARALWDAVTGGRS